MTDEPRWLPDDIPHFWRMRKPFPTDAAFAKAAGTTPFAVSAWKKQRGIEGKRGKPRAEVKPLARPHYRERRLMTEEEIAALYDGCRYEDEPRAVFDHPPALSRPMTDPRKLTLDTAALDPAK